MIRLGRRQFVVGASAAGLGLLAACSRLPGQAPPATKVPRIGFLQGGAPAEESGAGAGLQQGLRELGYVEGQNIVVESRYTEKVEELPGLAAELVRLPVDLMVVGGVA